MEGSLIDMLADARRASRLLSRSDGSARSGVLLLLADLLDAHIPEICSANARDMDQMDPADPKADRLRLTPDRIRALAYDTRVVAGLPDPTGKVLLSNILPNGLILQKISAPMGVVGVIYESRPNVTIDVASLCLRSGNACVLRGGSEAWFSNTALIGLVQEALRRSDLPASCATMIPTDRALLPTLLTADRYVDLLIPRGSQALIDFVRREATVPTIETGAGVCHTYVAPSADLDMAAAIVINAKTSRPSVCNALDTLLVHADSAAALLARVAPDFGRFAVEVFADELALPHLLALKYPFVSQATPTDFGREFLDYKCAVKVVGSFDEALDHIEAYSSRHSEAIVTADPVEQERFLAEVDAAAVYVNASTRFTDGGVFGLGAEIGISTQKLHARGPFALEKLVTEKWVIRGEGQIR